VVVEPALGLAALAVELMVVEPVVVSWWCTVSQEKVEYYHLHHMLRAEEITP
jgi:hypothetical protein